MVTTVPVIPTWSTLARCFADIRQRTWSTAQLVILDMAIDAICEEMIELNPRFDPELFRRTSHYNYYNPKEGTQ